MIFQFVQLVWERVVTSKLLIYQTLMCHFQEGKKMVADIHIKLVEMNKEIINCFIDRKQAQGDKIIIPQLYNNWQICTLNKP